MDTPRTFTRGADGKRYRTPFLTGAARRKVARSLAASYELGSSTRELAACRDMALGTVQRLLREADVQMRPRGDTRTPSPY